jgi:putative ABC transport system permease protein
MGRVLTSVETARRLAGAGGYNTIAVKLRPGIDPDAWVSRNQEALTGLDVKTTTAAQQTFHNLLDAFLAALVWVASISLFISGFLIYLTLSRAVLERASTIGLMRAVGASRRQLGAAVLSEAAALGVIFTAVGVVFGILVAAGMTRLLATLGFPAVGLVIRPGALVTGAVVGLGTTLISAFLPARRVARIPPGVAMRGVPMETGLSRSWVIGALSVAGGVALVLLANSPGTALSYVATAAVLLGSVLLVPPVLRPVASVLGHATRRFARGTGEVSIRHLVRERSRSAYTLGLLMIVLAGVFTFGAVDASIGRATDEVVNTQFGRPDALIRSDESSLPPTIERQVREQTGVAQTSAVRFASSKLVGTRWSLATMVVDPNTYFDVASFPFVSGDAWSARRDLRTGGVLLSAPIARKDHLRRGDRVSIATNQGPKKFSVAGVIKTLPALDAVLGVRAGREYLNSRDPQWILVKFNRGFDVESGIGSLRRALEGSGASVVTIGTLQHEFEHNGIRELVRVFLVILLVAAAIGLLGLANTMAISVAERRREIAVMRATGAGVVAIRRMVLVESATLGSVAFVLAIPLGLLMSALVTRGSSTGGLPLEFTFPARWVPIVGVIALIVTVIAALVPAYRAARVNPASALRFE